MGNRDYRTNPFNHEKRIRLLDQSGQYLDLISQIEAARLLRNDAAELLLVTPPALQLQIPTTEYKKVLKGLRQLAMWNTAHRNWLHARRTNLYGNYRIQGPDGNEMFHCNNQKALWYLNRDLVEIVSQDPPILRLKFIPNGPGHTDDVYYLTSKVNQCVVCGCQTGLNRHHVVPSLYRKHLPLYIKDHSYHDVLLLCLPCHEKYEESANVLKKEIAEELGIKLDFAGGELYDPTIGPIVKSAVALLRHGDKIPEPRREYLLDFVRNWCGKKEITKEDLEAASKLNAWHKNEEYIDHGQQVVAAIQDLQAFVERWREHFVNEMQPRYLPKFWHVAKPIVPRRFLTNSLE